MDIGQLVGRWTGSWYPAGVDESEASHTGRQHFTVQADGWVEGVTEDLKNDAIGAIAGQLSADGKWTYTCRYRKGKKKLITGVAVLALTDDGTLLMDFDDNGEIPRTQGKFQRVTG